MPALPPLLNVENPAETMRRAAALMRERAEAVSQEEESRGPWQAETVPARWAGFKDRGAPYASDVGSVHDATDQCLLVALPRSSVDHALVTYVASWHSGVAVAVADWLDFEAVNAPGPGEVYLRGGRVAYALAVARAYLGENA